MSRRTTKRRLAALHYARWELWRALTWKHGEAEANRVVRERLRARVPG
jgi:hypothetical protein